MPLEAVWHLSPQSDAGGPQNLHLLHSSTSREPSPTDTTPLRAHGATMPFLHRDDPAAPRTFAGVVAAGEVIAGPAVRLRSVGVSPGQAVRAAGRRDQVSGYHAGGSERPSRRLGVTPAWGEAPACWSC